MGRAAHTAPADAIEFYRRLFGWNTRATAFEPFDLYTVFERGTNQEGGLLKIHDDWDIEPQWTTFISVTDCDATMSAACDLGGESQFVHTVPKHGRIGSIADSGGARLALRGPVPAATNATARVGRTLSGSPGEPDKARPTIGGNLPLD